MDENEVKLENQEQTPAEQAPGVDAPKGKKEKAKKSLKREIFEWIMVFVVAFVLAFVVRTFLFEPVSVDGQSMMNTLQDHEFMIATKYDYLFGDPERFDVVICHYPDRVRPGILGIGEMPENFVKRVIGLPGETIELRAGELYVNGEHVEQNFDKTASTRDYGPYTVPQGCYFVMGDNRDHSNDSRNPQVGALSRSAITGHVQFVVFPLDSIRRIDR